MTFPIPVTDTLEVDLDHARTQFLECLAEDDRHTFQNVDNPDDLTNYTAQFMTNSQIKKATAAKTLNIVAALTEALVPYFEALGLVAQGVTAYTATVWGSIFLILKMASRFPGLFGKLCELLLEVSTHIPHYRKLLELFEADVSLRGQSIPSGMLNWSLHALYHDLLGLFGTMGSVFNQKERLNNAPLATPAMWCHPFDCRFDNFLNKLALHAKVLDSDMHTLAQKHAESLHDSPEGARIPAKPPFERMPQGHHVGVVRTSELIARIKAWLAPPYADAFERAWSLRQRATADWLFELPAYKSWLTFSPEMDGMRKGPGPLLWVRGNSGTGKTVLAAATLVNLRTSICSKNNGSKVLSYHFFDQGSPMHNPRRSAYASLLAQALDACSKAPDILDLFGFAITRRTQGQDFATVDEMADIIRLLKPLLPDWYIVIDAVDECDDPEKFLTCLLGCDSTHRPRILLFARPTIKYLCRKVPMVDTISMTPELLNPDLRRFFSGHLEEILSSNLFDRDTDVQELVAHLLTAADGVFQWAQLMLNYLKSEVPSPLTRVRTIKDLKRPENLEALYTRILTVIARKPYVERLFARRMFMWIIFGKGVARLHQLEDLLQTLWREMALNLTIEDQKACSSIFADFERSIVRVCSGLIEVIWEANLRARICRFVHPSVHEFFYRKCSRASVDVSVGTEGTEYLHPSPFEAESELLMACFHYRQHQDHQLLSGDASEAASSTALDDTRPFLRYATVSWTEHLAQPPNAAGETLAAVLQALGTFLADGTGRAAWVEALYTYKADCKKISSDLYQWASKVSDSYAGPYQEKVKEIAQMLHALVTSSRQRDKKGRIRLSGDPSLLRKDISTFTKNPFFAQPQCLVTATASQLVLPPKPERVSNLSSTPLCQISREKDGGNCSATLKIWPPWEFSNSFHDGHRHAVGASNAIYRGWIAQYQIWGTRAGNAVLKEQWEFPLNEEEIVSHMALQQRGPRPCPGSGDVVSLEVDAMRWFPVSIGENLDLFTVLHTVYILNREHPCSTQLGESNHCGWARKCLPIICDQRSLSVFQPVDGGVEDRPSSGGNARAYHRVFRTGRPAGSRIFVHNDLVIYQGIANSNCDRGLDHCSSRVVNESCFMAIFKIETEARNVSIRAVAILDGLDFANVINSCVFHPNLPLVALIWHTSSFYHRAALWSFASPSPINPWGVNHVTPVDFQDASAATDATVLVNFGPVARVRFSGCGNKLLVALLFHNYPGVFHLQDSPAYHAAVAEHEKSQVHTSAQRSGISRSGWFPHKAQSRLPGLLDLRQPQHTTQPGGLVGRRDESFSHEGSRLDQVVQDAGLLNRDVGCDGREMVLSRPASEETGLRRVSVHSPTRITQDEIDFSVDQAQESCYGWWTPTRPPPRTITTVGAIAPDQKTSYQYDQLPTPCCSEGEAMIISQLTANTQDVQATVSVRKTSMVYQYDQAPTPRYSVGEVTQEPSAMAMTTDFQGTAAAASPPPPPPPARKMSMQHHRYQQAPTPYYGWAECTLVDQVRATAPARVQQCLGWYEQDEAQSLETPALQGSASAAVAGSAAVPLEDWSLQPRPENVPSNVVPDQGLLQSAMEDGGGLGVGRGHGRVRVRSRRRGRGRGRGGGGSRDGQGQGRVEPAEAEEGTQVKRLRFE